MITGRSLSERRWHNESHDNQDHDAAAKDERSHESHDGEKTPDDS